MSEFVFDGFLDSIEDAMNDKLGLENLGLETNADYEGFGYTIGVRTHDGRYNWRAIVRTTAERIVDRFGLQFRADEVDRVRHNGSGAYLYEASRG